MLLDISKKEKRFPEILKSCKVPLQDLCKETKPIKSAIINQVKKGT